jgi:hypothetical protein
VTSTDGRSGTQADTQDAYVCPTMPPVRALLTTAIPRMPAVPVTLRAREHV